MGLFSKLFGNKDEPAASNQAAPQVTTEAADPAITDDTILGDDDLIAESVADMEYANVLASSEHDEILEADPVETFPPMRGTRDRGSAPHRLDLPAAPGTAGRTRPTPPRGTLPPLGGTPSVKGELRSEMPPSGHGMTFDTAMTRIRPAPRPNALKPSVAFESKKPAAKPSPFSRPAARNEKEVADANGRTPDSSMSALVDDLVAAADATFEADGTSGTLEAKLEHDQVTTEELTRLFSEISATHAVPIRDFMLELGLGDAPKAWLEVARPAVHAIRQAAASMQLEQLDAALTTFEEMLTRARSSIGGKISGKAREGLCEAYAAMVRVLPTAFELDKDRDRREPIIVHCLLSQVEGIHGPAIEALYKAGLGSLSRLIQASPEEIGQATGLRIERCHAIAERVRSYHDERTTTVPDAQGAHLRTRLGNLLKQLAKYQADFRLADEQEATQPRRIARRQRSSIVLDINLVLAQIGAVEVVSELEHVAVDRKIERVTHYLREAEVRAMPH